jgi:hypothetical protein
MKTLLAILLSFIISEAPVLAIHGGYTLGGSGSVVGTYAGVMIPTQINPLGTVVTSGTTIAGFGTNSLGLFTLSIPSTGVGTGSVLIFASGQNMLGNIQAVPDPESDTGIIGVIQATGEITGGASTNDFAFLFVYLTGEGAGGLTASVVQANAGSSPTGTNLTGTAGMTFSVFVTDTNGNTNIEPSESVAYQVEGYQQSTAATSAGSETFTTTSGT